MNSSTLTAQEKYEELLNLMKTAPLKKVSLFKDSKKTLNNDFLDYEICYDKTISHDEMWDKVEELVKVIHDTIVKVK